MDWLNYLILAFYIVSMIVITIFCRKKASSTKDFLLAGDGLGGWMTAFAYGITYFSSVIFIGYAGKFGWSFGMAAMWIGLGNALIGSYLAWKVLAKRTRNFTKYYQTKTMPEMFEKRYNSKYIKILASIVMFVFLIPYSASVYQGLAEIFESAFKIDFRWGVGILAALTAVYVFFGGYFATAVTDFIQGLIMIAGLTVMILIIFEKVDWDFSTLSAEGFGLFNHGTGKVLDLIVIIILTSFGIWGLPQSVHKFYAVKGNKAIKKATIISTIFCLIIGVGAYAAGSISQLVYPNGYEAAGLTATDQIMPDILTKFLPAGVIGLIVVLVLSASMSTLDALSMSASSTISIDLYKGYIKKNATDKQVNMLMKSLCVGFIALSVILALFKVEAIVTLMGLSWGTLAGCFIGPYVYGIYWKKTTKAGAYASIITSLTLTLTLLLVFGATLPSGDGGLIKEGIKWSPHIGVICMIASMIVTPTVSFITKKQYNENKESVEDMFKIIKLPSIDDYQAQQQCENSVEEATEGVEVSREVEG